MATPYLDELVRRLRLDDPEVFLDVPPSGAATVSWQQADVDHPLVLVVGEADLASAVRTLGEGCRDDLWPDHTVDSAGFNLLTVHLDEVVATRDTTDPLRITEHGLQWPDAVLPLGTPDP